MTVATVCKVDTGLRLVCGWACVSKVGGRAFFDSQGDHLPESIVLEAALRFAEGDRVLKAQHSGSPMGQVVFMWPATTEINDAMGTVSKQTGLMIGVRVDDDAMLQRFKSGSLRGFSIGGKGRRELSSD